jgi:hypothetical protein
MAVKFIHTTTEDVGIDNLIGDRRMTIAYFRNESNSHDVGVSVCSKKDH